MTLADGQLAARVRQAHRPPVRRHLRAQSGRPAPAGRATRSHLLLPTLPTGPKVLAGAAGVFALCVVLRWLTPIGPLPEFTSGENAMSFNAALGLLTLAMAWQTRLFSVVAALLGFTSFVALATLTEYATNTDLGMDRLAVLDLDPTSSSPGRMAAATAACLLVLCIARVLVLAPGYRAAQVGAHLVATAAGLAMLGHIYGITGFYKVGATTSMQLPTAGSLLVMSGGTLLAVPDGFASWLGRGSDAGAAMMRRLLPVAVLAIPSIGYAALLGTRLGWWDRHVEAALIVVGTVFVVLAVTVRAAHRLADVDRRRGEALVELQALNSELERRVAERTARLEQEQGRRAVLEYRERIAADLHDHVIQRLYAAGLQLSSLSQTPEGAAAQTIGNSIDAIDASIRELRGTILAIREPGAQSDPVERIRVSVSESARVLGFTPSLTITGEATTIPAEVAEELDAVLREALANVARHARAGSAAVDLSLGPGQLCLTVTDDGVGMDPGQLAHSSGTANIRKRAERHGGSATWTSTPGHGTVLNWSVPVGTAAA